MVTRHRELAGMMRAAAGEPPVSDLPWVHKWDFTNVSGSTVPDIVGSSDLTLSGGYTANSSGVTPTNDAASASVLFSSLDIDLTAGGDAFSVILTFSNIDTQGQGNLYGRFFDTYVLSNQAGPRIYFSDSLVEVKYQIAGGSATASIIIPNASTASSISAITDTDGRNRLLVDGGVYQPASQDGPTECYGTYLYLLNRSSGDRAPDGTCTGAGVLSRALTNTEALQAAAELLAL